MHFLEYWFSACGAGNRIKPRVERNAPQPSVDVRSPYQAHVVGGSHWEPNAGAYLRTALSVAHFVGWSVLCPRQSQGCARCAPPWALFCRPLRGLGIYVDANRTKTVASRWREIGVSSQRETSRNKSV